VATALGKTVLVLFPIFIGAFAGIYFSFTTDIWPRVFGFIICTVWAIAIIAIAVRAAGRAEWRRCLGWIVVLLAILPMSFVLAFRVGDYIHLAMMWQTYQSTIRTNQGRRVVFEWRTIEMMFGQVERTLIYDPADSEASKPDTHNYYNGYFVSHRRLFGHFYLVENSPWRGCAQQQPDAC
jgi:hypothetical protein